MLLAALALEPMRLPAVVVLVVLLAGAIRRSRSAGRPPASIAFVHGACLLVAITATWSGVPLPAAARDGTSCALPLAPFALYRVSGAVLVLSSVGAVARLLGSTPTRLGLVWPGWSSIAIAAAGLIVVGGVATVIGPVAAEPFFGPLPLDLRDPAALVPALLFALSNATMEEIVYRGALLRWLSPSIGPTTGLIVQAVAFGLAHGVGDDFAGSPLPVVAATAIGGAALGVVARRTGSLVLPIALHAALDVPIYYANACLRP
jgi:membrane protease YdiL (CAAX protease family)